ncbi:hypothetical protein ONS95_012284 [Cadophora gregata]|uniref:uncharacterized protein n=1 Tax=Cadophora gregata TaxID=51156 RepID=UPI0026DDC9C9|nr:uncharacterized protein ONS95_012284 [Cadophora gregata]KAK0117973.1 hypothetical protein ONS95_012284 [Cadophora gregata]KAK0123037.1 hypothetical protein ONS96_010047 [Cadophora gregata f. sp. sojae]
MLRTIFGKKEETVASSSSTMASSISVDDFKEALGRYPEALKTHGKTPKDGSTTLEELDKFRYQTAPMNFSKATGRVMELSDVEKLVQWKIHHGVFRPTLPKLVASNTNDSVADATKDAFAAYAKDNKDIATVISKLSALKGIGPATASLLLAIHDPQNVVFFSDELFSYLTADGKKIEPKYTTKEFEAIFAEAQTVMSRLKCTPIELEKVAYVLIKEKTPEVKKSGRPALPESEKKVKPVYVPSGKPRGRPAMSEAEKKAQQSRREAERAKAAKAVTNRTRTGRIVKPAALLINESGTTTKKTRVKRTVQPARKATTVTNTTAEKKRGRPAKGERVEETKPIAGKKRGRPAKGEGVEESKPKIKATATTKAGRPAKAQKSAASATKKTSAAKAKDATAPAKKRGRPTKVETVEEVKTPKQPSRSAAAEAAAATPASKKRGRPSMAAAEEDTKTPASKKRKTTASPAPASSAKRGSRTPASAAASSVKRSGRKANV